MKVMGPSRISSVSTGAERAKPGSKGLQIPDHVLLRPIASGAYGEVWLARNAVGTLRAVKIVRRDQHALAASFEREFNGLQKFEPISRTHEGLVDILTLGLLPDDAGFYYVMELADQAEPRTGGTRPPPSSDSIPKNEDRLGGSLAPATKSESPDVDYYVPRTLRAELKCRGALPADEVIALGLKLTSALTHLHASGLVHRDVKPSNILFIGGEPKLADAGLVAALDDAWSLVGTAGYIAPEGPGTPQGDLYALGKVLYEAAFGKDRQEFPALPADVASRPDHAYLLELNEIIAKACAHDPKRRYPNADMMRAELQFLESGKSVKLSRAGQRIWLISKKAGLGTLLIVLAMIFISVWFRRSGGGYVQSSNPEVNQWVEEGFNAILQERPERCRYAEECFRKAIQLEPKFVPAYYGLATADIHLLDDAHMVNLRATTDTLMKLAPHSADAVQMSAFVKWRNGHYQKALDEARRASVLPALCRLGHAWAHGSYGFFLQSTGDAEGALREYRNGLRIVPFEPTLNDHLGHTFLMRSNFVEALHLYEASLKIQPYHPNGLVWRARTYEEMGKFDKAIDSLEKLDQVEGDGEAREQNFHEGLREAFKQRGADGYWRYQLREMLKEHPESFYQIATLHARLKEWPQAYVYLEKAASKHDPALESLLFDLCWDRSDEHFKRIATKIGLMQ